MTARWRRTVCALLALATGAVAAMDVLLLRIERQDGGVVSYRVEVARTDAQRQQGLMARRRLPKDTGMLFDFGAEQPVAMWMRNTWIALDMLFADAEGEIVEVIAHTVPLSDTLLQSRAPARYVVELAAGQAAAQALAPGDRLQLPLSVRTSPSAK
mgnify:CR=1 FL=1